MTTAVSLVSDATCSTCHGSGAAPGSAPVTCDNCGGRGVLDENQGLFSFSQPCPVCGVAAFASRIPALRAGAPVWSADLAR